VSGAPLRRALVSVLALAFAASCTQSVQPKPSPAHDVEVASKLARDASAILLQFSAYDYGLAGALAGEKTRTVAPPRYGTIARGSARSISAFSGNVLAATLDRSGPIRDKLVPLADGLADLAKDGEAYAGGGDSATFARVITGVTAGWERLLDLSTVLAKDDMLESTIARGTSFVVTANSATQSTVTAGPYASLTEASQALRSIGSPLNATVTQASPFVVRLGPYPTRATADAVSGELAKQGITSVVTDEQSYTFTRSGPVPDAELWREPSRVQETRGSTRKLAVSGDGSWLVTGGDDGYAALFDPSGALRALPQSYAGMSVLAFADDGRFFAAGGQVVNILAVPSGQLVGSGMRFTGAATQIMFVPTSRLFVAASKGPTGESSGGPGLIGGRAPDGAPLGDPFPIVTPAAGAQIASSDAGDVYIGTTSGGAYDVEVFRPGRDVDPRPVARITGVGRALAIDRTAKFAAVVTDQGTFRFALADAKTLTRVAGMVRDIAFAPDGTLYVMDQTSLAAIGADGAPKWTTPLVDGRRLFAARRAIVLDGTDRLLAFAPADGTAEELGASGAISDVTMSRDGRVIGAIVDTRRAVLFTLP
jgi:WD40 domain-containing protein